VEKSWPQPNPSNPPKAEAVDAWTTALVTTAETVGRQLRAPCPDDNARYRAALAITYGQLESLLRGAPTAELHPALAAVNKAWPADAHLLAVSYERVLDHCPLCRDGLFTLEEVHGQRKPSGSYFTPPNLVRILIDHTLLPILNQRLINAAFNVSPLDPLKVPPIFQWTPEQRVRAENALLETTICDPACGPGNFLLAVLDVLTERLLWLRNPDGAVDESEYIRAHHDIADRCLYGVDQEPQTIAVARLALWLVAGSPQRAPAQFARHLRVGDSLGVVPPAPGMTDPSRQPQPVDWSRDFPEVTARGGFDVILGNPPFANAIEGGVPPAIKEQLARHYPGLGGTADLSYYFLDLAHRIAKPEGAVGLVLPRGILTGRSVQSLRSRLLHERPPCLIYAPQDQYLFPGANVFVVLLGLRPAATCLASRDPDEPRLQAIQIHDANWWAPLLGDTRPSQIQDEARIGLGGMAFDTHSQFHVTARIGDQFEVFASMTTGMAYDLLPFVSDQPREESLKLITTGLIDPGECHWGKRVCRYLKRRFEQPFVHEEPAMPASIRARLAKVRRPKILVAGLSTRVEALLDESGQYCGAVSTFTIVDPQDDVLRLRQLTDWLNAPPATEALHRELGAHAMGGGRITLSKQFLMQLPLPTTATNS
jgi:hypothetical protein